MRSMNRLPAKGGLSERDTMPEFKMANTSTTFPAKRRAATS